MTATASREDLYVPDRFEGLHEANAGALRSIVHPVQDSLNVIDSRFREIRTSRRGGLMILKGTSGAGKTTFVQTIGLFRDELTIETVPATADVQSALAQFSPTSNPRIIVLEGREALGEVSAPAIEASLHAINGFVRSPAGLNSLVIWPVNTDELVEILTNGARQLGAEALFGTKGEHHIFTGPPRDHYIDIAEKTVGALNEGASLITLGVSHEKAVELTEKSPTIGSFLGRIRDALLENYDTVYGLLPIESLRLWVVVISGNQPENAVAAVTRGRHAFSDVDRMMTATNANIVEELKKHPDQLGILAGVLDARVLHLDIVTVLAMARTFANDQLRETMRQSGMSVATDKTAISRLQDSDLGQLITGGTLGTGKRGKKPGSETKAAFEKLAHIARTNDVSLNRAIGAALTSAGLINSYEVEKTLGTKLVYKSDVYCDSKHIGPIRLEMMWRSSTNTAEVSNYTLGKLNSYGKAIGLLT